MSTKSLLLVPALLGLAVAPLLAADYEPPVVELGEIAPVEDYVPVEIGTGWYLRGDIGYSFSTSAGAGYSVRMYDPGTATYANRAYTGADFDNGFSYGVGFGYRFTDLFRADITADRFSMNFNGTTARPEPCVGQAAGTCTTADRATVTGTSLLANAYVDFGTFARFTPYAGVGAGLTNLNWSAVTSTQTCATGACAGAVTTATYPGIDSWRFTWAAMGGIAYDINPNLKVDLGYRYRRIAGGPMYRYDAASTAAGAVGTQGRDGGLSQHEVKIGLRYELW